MHISKYSMWRFFCLRGLWVVTTGSWICPTLDWCSCAAYTKRLRYGHNIGSHELYYYILMPSFIRIIWENTSRAAGSSTIHDLCTLLPASGSRSRWSPPSLLSRGHFNKTRGRYLLNDNIIKICIQRPFLSESKMVPAEQMDSEFSLAHQLNKWIPFLSSRNAAIFTTFTEWFCGSRYICLMWQWTAKCALASTPARN